MTVRNRSLAALLILPLLPFLSGCRQPKISYLDDALDRKAASKEPFPEPLRALAPRLPQLVSFVNTEAQRQGLKGWPEPWPEWWGSNGPKDPLLKKVWANPKVLWFCDPFMTRWDAVLVMESADEGKLKDAIQLVLIEDAFGSKPRFSALFKEPRITPSSVVTWGHPVLKNKVWFSSDEAPAWGLAPYVYPRQTAILTTPVDVDWYMRFVYSPNLGIAVWGAWGMVSGNGNDQGKVIGEDEYFVWHRVDGLTSVRPKDPQMDEMKGPSFFGWVQLP